ncbi:hypothetical protein FRC12_005576 [Ceratobasidium sp. 428]|nr:hypothetical protein FRC12_005576 [Ceratobasidium sp. 428]
MSLAAPRAFPTFAKFRLLHHRATSPHGNPVSFMLGSDSGKWILTGSNGQMQKTLAITDAWDLSSYLIIDTGHVWATCATWAGDEVFLTAFNDGCLYRCQLQGSGDKVITMSYITKVAGSIIAISVERSLGYLAIATTRETVILQRHHMPIVNEAEPIGYCFIARLALPFSPEASATSLAWYGDAQKSLVVGTSAGLAVYSMFKHEPRLTVASWSYPIAHCLVSRDYKYLVALTTDNCLICWDLKATGPLIHDPAILELSDSAIVPGVCSAPLLTITSTNVITVVTLNGQLCFMNAQTKQLCGMRLCGGRQEIQAVRAVSDRLYVTAANNSGPGHIEIIAYTLNPADFWYRDFILRQPKNYAPHIKLLTELVSSSSQASAKRSNFIVRHPIRIGLAIMFLAFVIYISWVGAGCFVSPEDLDGGLRYLDGDYLTFVAVCVIHTCLPHSLIKPAISILFGLLFVFQFLIALAF